jgi:hypothetical protein
MQSCKHAHARARAPRHAHADETFRNRDDHCMPLTLRKRWQTTPSIAARRQAGLRRGSLQRAVWPASGAQPEHEGWSLPLPVAVRRHRPRRGESDSTNCNAEFMVRPSLQGNDWRENGASDVSLVMGLLRAQAARNVPLGSRQCGFLAQFSN